MVIFVNASDASGGEDLYSSGGGEFHGCTDGGGGVDLLVEGDAEVGGVGFEDMVGGEHGVEFFIGHADGGGAVDDADEGGGGALVLDDLSEFIGQGFG